MERYHFSNQERALMEGLQQPFAVYQFLNKRVVTLILSDGFCELFGYEDRAQAYFDMDNDMYKDVHPDDVARIAAEALRFAVEGGSYEVIYRTHRKSGGYVVVHAQGRHVWTRDGVRLAHVWYTNEGSYAEGPQENMSELNRTLNNALHEESILKASTYDQLTGLPSMTYFFELADAGRTQLLSEGEQPALLFFDLSGMKFFNRRFGYAEGDRLLKAFSRLLVATFSNESCCHFGGDHFAAFAPERGLEKTLLGLFEQAEKLNDGKTLHVRVGIYLNRTEAVPVSTACDRAKFACDEIRSKFVSGMNYYDRRLRDKLELRQYILANLDRALAEERILVYYQPIVRAVNGRVCDEEALARWNDPERGFLSPADFISFLEDAGQIYKLDLYVLERVLKKLSIQREQGLFMVPQSINLSRADFDACDLVEEVRRRVDASGIAREYITVELTESSLGVDIDFMKTQVERFRALGFRVWMDDFGTGYSSLEVLQHIPFDLIKFDRSFLLRLDEDERGKIILTELMRMANALGLDTVCEGVETAKQKRFLQEIGCSKLQGFYYCRPIPLDEILERYRRGVQIGFENPEESDYYETVGRANLYDLTAITDEGDRELRRFFNTLPMAVMELKDEQAWIVRCNRSYRGFIRRLLGIELLDGATPINALPQGQGEGFMRTVREACRSGARELCDERMQNGAMARSLFKRIAVNPVTGKSAVAVAVLSVSDADEGTSYASIARALATDYHFIYYVNLITEDFIEYSSPIGGEGMAVERHGKDFFRAARQDAEQQVYEPDRAHFLEQFTKQNVLKVLDENGVFTLIYRLVEDDTPMYMAMKLVRMLPDRDHIIIGVSVVDTQMRRRVAANEIKKDSDVYARILALDGRYLSLYVIDPETGSYREYSAAKEFDALGYAKQGEDFFGHSIINSKSAVYPEDHEKFLREFTGENIMKHVLAGRVHEQSYRLMLGGKPHPVTLRIALVNESDGKRLIAGVRLKK